VVVVVLAELILQVLAVQEAVVVVMITVIILEVLVQAVKAMQVVMGITTTILPQAEAAGVLAELVLQVLTPKLVMVAQVRSLQFRRYKYFIR
jgi:hypothetical protein